MLDDERTIQQVRARQDPSVLCDVQALAIVVWVPPRCRDGALLVLACLQGLLPELPHLPFPVVMARSCGARVAAGAAQGHDPAV